MSRRALTPVLLAFACPAALGAQESAPPERIDILVDTTPDIVGPIEDCSEEEEAAAISGEIVVCRRLGDQGQYRYSTNEEAAMRYARETMYANDLAPVDVAGAGIFRGAPTVSGLCVIPPCPREMPIMIDLKALPEAPAGSDADRVGRGLAPRGRDVAAAAPDGQARREGLGLPPPPDFAGEDAPEPVNPAGSEAPEAER